MTNTLKEDAMTDTPHGRLIDAAPELLGALEEALPLVIQSFGPAPVFHAHREGHDRPLLGCYDLGRHRLLAAGIPHCGQGLNGAGGRQARNTDARHPNHHHPPGLKGVIPMHINTAIRIVHDEIHRAEENAQ